MELKKQRFCKECGRKVLAIRQVGCSDGMAVLLIVLTLGIFLPIFIIWRLLEAVFQSYRCPVCGSKC
jgi:competence CoiA-like predicted nuclease